MQLSKLLTPKAIIRLNSNNGQSIFGFGLPQLGDESQDHVKVTVDGEYVSLQPL